VQIAKSGPDFSPCDGTTIASNGLPSVPWHSPAGTGVTLYRSFHQPPGKTPRGTKGGHHADPAEMVGSQTFIIGA